VFKSIGHALTVNDVLTDAHNTFIKDLRVEEIGSDSSVAGSGDLETQLDTIINKDNVFTWNEEDEKEALFHIKTKHRRTVG